ncbi:hypothetical protein [Halalkalicoccus tibetensis]|uniref:DUF2188 domain-containing protein n=1 Tax=Halalkalicoccus tibetensis TaxID=175632 RepID=A0ABD5V322_9EURY
MFRCLDCDWSSTAVPQPDHRGVTERAISHHVETGHELTATTTRGRSPTDADRAQEASQPAE